ncbi:hypothetical protein DI43_08405 [Geobacillus sp. CAMR12739]|nr:hypothetical protein DI43_08405 [Geobacillus sp. CAMR12739]
MLLLVYTFIIVPKEDTRFNRVKVAAQRSAANGCRLASAKTHDKIKVYHVLCELDIGGCMENIQCENQAKPSMRKISKARKNSESSDA